MTVKKIQRPDGHFIKFGRKRPIVRHPTLQLKNYLVKEKLAAPPPGPLGRAAAASAALAEMYLNDQLGDCVIAAIEHAQGVMTGNANPPPLLFTDVQTETFYGAACGYVQGDESTDQGCYVQDTLAYWQQNGNPAGSTHVIQGVLAVDPTNPVEVQTAIWLFIAVIYGMELPDAWITPFPSVSGFVWDTAGPPDPANGHCFPALDYDSKGNPEISTWAMTGTLTLAASAYYTAAAQGGECYAVISQDSLNKASQLCPAGINWAALVADWNALGGNLTPPVPVPPVPVPPVPVPPVPVPPVPPPLPPSVVPITALETITAWYNHQNPRDFQRSVRQAFAAVEAWLETQ